jgi:transcriptional regulator with PAS, ATPase and Fis domain
MSTSRKLPSGLMALKKIVEGTSESTGQQFFDSLVKNLGEILGVHGVWITEYLEEQNRLRALSFFLDGKFVDEYEYKVTGTPCEPVLENEGICHVPERVIELFPNDPDLEPLGAVSYMGIALKDIDGKVLGHLAMLDDKPMEEIPEAFAIFNIFASRATAELRRLNSDKILIGHKEKLNRLINGSQELILEFDESLHITQVNEAAIKTLNFPIDSYEKKPIADLLDVASFDSLLSAVQLVRAQGLGLSSLWVNGPLYCLPQNKAKIPVEGRLSAYQYRGKNFYALFIRSIREKIASEKTIRKLDLETTLLREKINENQFDEIIGNSDAIKKTTSLISRVAKTDSTVLVEGETGTGKELIARAIFKSSLRKDEPFITLNCASLPSELIESELFGHIKGAFTGATASRDGRFLLADKGTIFLDEIGELPLQLQPKLLRVLQEGTFEPVGSAETRKVNVRIISATNRDLQSEIKKGSFREDLFYRLNIFPISVPPLRNRGKDVELLAEAFIQKFSKRYGFKVKALDHATRSAISKYTWPGNVRELQNIVERAIIISQNGQIDLVSLLSGGNEQNKADVMTSDQDIIYNENEMREKEKLNIIKALEMTGWKISGSNGAASLLGIPSTTLNSRIMKLGISLSNHK